MILSSSFLHRELEHFFWHTLRERYECVDWLVKTEASFNDTLKFWNSYLLAIQSRVDG